MDIQVFFGFAPSRNSRYGPGMERNETAERVSFWQRVGFGFKVMLDGELAGRMRRALRAPESKAPALAPEKEHASGLLLLGALQREGRLLDFLQQEVAGFSDEQVGAAARVVHAGCGKVLKQYFELEPAAREPEGTEITVPKGFDAQRIRLTGNVAGQPPFRGTLRHHGWVVREIRLPAVSPSLDPRLVAPAEVELS
jgi:hypothetical protein